MLLRPQPKPTGVRPRPTFPRFLAGSAVLAFAGLAQPVQAQTTGTFAPGLTESGTGLTLPFNAGAATYMGYLDASEFSELTSPVLITGISFRLASGYNSQLLTSAWPSQDLTFSNFNIQLAEASAADETAGDLEDSTSFASNQNASTVRTVRSGALTVAADSFTNSLSGTNTFGPTLAFSTPYTYTPGESLTYLIDESGYGTSQTQAAFASSSISNFSPFTADALDSSAGTDQTAPTGYTDPLIVQFQYETEASSPVPEASTTVSLGLLLALGAGAVAVKRRRTQNQHVS